MSGLVDVQGTTEEPTVYKGIGFQIKPRNGECANIFQTCLVRPSDGMEFKVVVEASMMTFDEPYDRGDGRIGYKTTEVFKRGAR